MRSPATGHGLETRLAARAAGQTRLTARSTRSRQVSTPRSPRPPGQTSPGASHAVDPEPPHRPVRDLIHTVFSQSTPLAYRPPPGVLPYSSWPWRYACDAPVENKYAKAVVAGPAAGSRTMPLSSHIVLQRARSAVQYATCPCTNWATCSRQLRELLLSLLLGRDRRWATWNVHDSVAVLRLPTGRSGRLPLCCCAAARSWTIWGSAKR